MTKVTSDVDFNTSRRSLNFGDARLVADGEVGDGLEREFSRAGSRKVEEMSDWMSILVITLVFGMYRSYLPSWTAVTVCPG